MRFIGGGFAALLAAAALGVYGVEHDSAHPDLTLQANEHKVFRPGQAPAGTKIVCLAPGSPVFARVPRYGGVTVFADGIRYSSSISLDLKRDGSVVAGCR